MPPAPPAPPRRLHHHHHHRSTSVASTSFMSLSFGSGLNLAGGAGGGGPPAASAHSAPQQQKPQQPAQQQAPLGGGGGGAPHAQHPGLGYASSGASFGQALVGAAGAGSAAAAAVGPGRGPPAMFDDSPVGAPAAACRPLLARCRHLMATSAIEPFFLTGFQPGAARAHVRVRADVHTSA
jgi:hypothetical protein